MAVPLAVAVLDTGPVPGFIAITSLRTVVVAVPELDAGPVLGLVSITSLIIAFPAKKHARSGTMTRQVANWYYFLPNSFSCVHVLIEPY
jgi:hypothetical protein